VTIHVQSLANVPAIRHHAAAFAQAVVNALTNAIDAAADDGSVWLRFEDAADKVDVIVEDDGPGLSEEQERCVWDAFYTTKVNGTGLGTVVMRQVMHEHGGSVELKNLGDGRGLSVRLALPKRNSSRPPAERYVAT
jgi:two-component system sporulation sensor kinase A